MAGKHSIRLKKEFETNTELIADFGISPGYPWTETKFFLQRTGRLKDPSVEAIGIGQAITGGRFDLIVCDDILSDKNTLTPEMREKVESWFFGTLEPVLTPDGQFLVIGTCKHYEDLYTKIAKLGTGFTVDIKPAILNEQTQQVLWAEEWSYKRLVAKREEFEASLGHIGTLLFLREYQNQPVRLEGEEFKLEWLRYYRAGDGQKPDDLPRYAGVDPGIGKKDQASYTAICTIEVDTTNRKIYVVDFWRGKVSLGRLPQVIGELYETYGWRAVAIESVFWQAELARAMSNYGLPVIPVDYKRQRIAGDKVARLQELGIPFSQGQIWLPETHPLTSVFVQEEYVTFPEGTRTDLLDSLFLARIACPIKQPSRYEFV
jgi:phage terminase large subunit-like protein